MSNWRVDRAWARRLPRWLIPAALACWLAAATPAWAGRPCEERPPSAESLAKTFDAALQLKGWLDRHQPDVAVLARRGQNLGKYGLTYSHAGYVLRDGQGGWTVLHELNRCGTAQSNLFEQGLAEFLGDDLYALDVAVVVPKPDVQQSLRAALASAERFRMHHAHYSAVAYPFSTKYQNSNGWLVETFARAVSREDLQDRSQAQAWLKLVKYEPSTLELGPLTRLGGRAFKANVAFDDHPGHLRWAGHIQAHTGDGVLKLVSRWGQPQADCPHGGFDAAVCTLSLSGAR